MAARLSARCPHRKLRRSSNVPQGTSLLGGDHLDNVEAARTFKEDEIGMRMSC